MIKNTKFKLHASPTVIFGVLAIAGATVPAYAGLPVPIPPIQASHVTDTVSDNGNGTFNYGFTVHNDGSTGGIVDGGEFFFIEPVIRDWELPYFADSGITGIDSPNGWNYAIETIGTANAATGWGGVAAWQDPNDPFYFGNDSPFTDVTQVLHWYTDDAGLYGIYTNFFEGIASLSGFSFTADFDQTAAPYQASWVDLPIQSGDPAFPFGGVPASPNALGTQVVPEPEMLALLAAGLTGWSVATKRKKRKQAS